MLAILKTTLVQIRRAQISEQSEKGCELWSFFLMLQTAPALRGRSVPSVLLSDQCLSGHMNHKAQPSPTPSAGYLGKCHTTGIYHPRQPRLKQTSTLVQSQPHTNKLPNEWPKWSQLYTIKAIITTWINISRYLLFPKVVNKPIICSHAWGFIRAWVEHSALGPSVGATDTS